MPALAARPYAIAAAALAATSLIAVTPVAPRLPDMPVTSLATRLLAGDSILNVPINLLYDLANIPYNEVQALDTLAGSLFMTGNWWVPSSTNIWGIDPGDPTHVAAILNVLPFPALTQGYGGLEYQLDGLLAAELPVNASCDAEGCAPIVPSNIVTGITSIDHGIGFNQALTGQVPFGLFENWFKVPLFGPDSLTSGYFFDPSAPGSVDPSGPVSAGFGFPQTGAAIPNPFEGGTTPITGQDMMPWAGQTFTLNLFQPFENFFNSLMAPPATDGIAGTGIELPTFTELLQGLQAVAAGLVVDFDPFTAGSPACPEECVAPFGPPFGQTIPDIVKALDPTNSNPMIQEWLQAVKDGTVNNATPTQIQDAINMLQTGVFTLPQGELDQVNASLAALNPVLPDIAKDSGWLGGYNPDALIADFQQLLGGGAASAAAAGLGTTLSPDLFTTTLPADLFGTLSTDLSTQLSADLNALLADFGTNLPAFFSTLPADLLSLF